MKTNIAVAVLGILVGVVLPAWIGLTLAFLGVVLFGLIKSGVVKL